MNDRKIKIKIVCLTSHMIIRPPPPSTNCHTFSVPLPLLERGVLDERLLKHL